MLFVWLTPHAASGAADFSPLQPVGRDSPYVFERLGGDVGIPQANILSVKQSRDGYLWIATSSGLGRFDGVRFEHFRVSTTPAFLNHFIHVIFEDRDGIMWFGTERGVIRYASHKFERVGLDQVGVRAICQDSSGRMWFGTHGDGLYSWDRGTFVRSEDPLLTKHVDYLFLDSAGRMWIGQLRVPGALIYQDGSFRPFRNPQIRSELRCAAEVPKGHLWLAGAQSGGGGLICLRPDGTIDAFNHKNGLAEVAVDALAPARDGGLWLTCGGLQKIDDPTKPVIRTLAKAVGEGLGILYEDAENNLWICARTDGLLRGRERQFRTLSADDGLPGVGVRSVTKDRAGNMWLAIQRGPMTMVSPDGTITECGPKLGFPARGSGVVHAARDGAVWFTYETAVFVWRDGTLKRMKDIPTPASLYEDSRGRMWVGTSRNGVYCFETDEPQHYRLSVDRASNRGTCFSEGPNGDMYLGTWDGGVFRLKPGGKEFEDMSDGMPTLEVRAIYADKEGRVWVGLRSRGLGVYDNGRWLNPAPLAESVADHVVAILEDDENSLWLGTVAGIMRAPINQLLSVARGDLKIAKWNVIGVGEGGFATSAFSGPHPVAWKSSPEEFLFATRRGLYVISPKKVRINRVTPTARLERVAADHQDLPIDGEVSLAPGTRTLEFRYTAISFVGANRMTFKYKLEGYDSDWIDAGTRREAHYTQLAPGSYRFRVLASNSDGVWDETGAQVALTLRPFFYQTLWFRLSGVLSIALAVFGLHRRHLNRARSEARRLQQQNEELERRVSERTAELAKSYETLRASEYFYHSLVESLPQIILRKDADSRYTYANSAYAELIGKPLAEVIGKTDADFHPAELARKYRQDDLRVMQTHQTLEYETVVEQQGRRRYLHVKEVPLYGSDNAPLGVQVLFWDVTVFRETEERLKEAQRELLETSRLAGMAEVAAGVLHNIGNAVNSVNISATLLDERLRASKLPGLGKVAELLLSQRERIVEFFTTDPRGAQVPTYLAQLTERLQADRDEALKEVETLRKGVEHIKEIVVAQQGYAQVSGLTEIVTPSELVEYAVRVSDTALTRHGVTVTREFMPVPPVNVQRQKALQVLVNLIRNAKEAVEAAGHADRRITLGVRTSPEGKVQISVTDNGIGIAQENLTRIFAFGFTTKKNGHGFGLHSSALVAKETGGALHVRSDGLGKGATFIFELPAHVEARTEVAAAPA